MVSPRMAVVRVAVRRAAGHTLMLSVLLSSGCAQSPARTMARVWDDLPKVRMWDSKGDDDGDREPSAKQLAKAQAEKHEEEKPSRGLAGRYRVASKSSEQPLTDETPEKSLLGMRKQSSPRDPFLEDDLAQHKTVQEEHAAHSSTAEHDDVSPRDRLKAALSDDSRRQKQPPRDLAKQDRLRLRVESLMRRAQDHVDQDDLPAAFRAYELAHHVAEAGGLEFAPDEERPIDLLTSLAEQLESEVAERVQTESEENGPSAAQVEIKPAFTSENLDRAGTFDPYAGLGEAKQPRHSPSRFTASMVVLESPSFDEQETAAAVDGVSPTGYARKADRPQQAMTAPARYSRTPHVMEPIENIPLPSIQDDATDVDDSLAPPDEKVMLTSPPAPLADGPRFGTVELENLQADDEEDPAGVEPVRPAGVWPRWMPLSGLSLLTAGLCFWLWHRRNTMMS